MSFLSKAVSEAIPMNPARLIDGMRNWFKWKEPCDSASAAAGPARRRGRSADRAPVRDHSAREEIRYYTPQKRSSGASLSSQPSKSSSPKIVWEKIASVGRKKCSRASRTPARKQRHCEDGATRSRSKALSDADSDGVASRHGELSHTHNMPRKLRCSKRKSVYRPYNIILPEPESTDTNTLEATTDRFIINTSEPDIPISTVNSTDIIDLTEESPLNTALRQKRSHPDDSITVLNDFSDTSKRQKKTALVIDLDSTINLDSTETSLNDSTGKPSLSCPICLENFMTTNIKAMTTPCGHIFCTDCLSKITQTTKKCPMCQRLLSLKKCIRLHI